MKSSDQLRRMVQLVPFLLANPGVSLSRTAEVFNTKREVILKDLAVIQFVGLPGGYTDDLINVDLDYARQVGEIYISNAEVLAKPMTLTQDQANNLSVALLSLIELGVPEAATALAKLQQACGATPEGVSVEFTLGDEQVRSSLISACEQGRAALITHRKADGLTQVKVEPARLRTDAGALYLDAWSVPRQAWRSFLVERIETVELLPDPVTEHPGLEEATAGWFSQVSSELELELSPAGRWVGEHYPTTSIQETETGVRLRLPVSNREWAVALLLRLGDAVLKITQPELARRAAETARQALSAYRSSDDSSKAG